jgi:hypothetical protein
MHTSSGQEVGKGLKKIFATTITTKGLNVMP